MSLIDSYQGPPDKQRLMAAMRGEPTDRVPNFEVLIEDQHVERLLGARRAIRWAWVATRPKGARPPRACVRCTRTIISNCAASSDRM